METNTCGINHFESEVLLPPRKRLLAGFKKQNADANGSSSPSKLASSSTACASSNVQTNLNNLLAFDLNDPNLTPEEIAEASRSAAVAAAGAAEAARAAADEKAAVAAKAVAAAKSALDLVASFPDDAAAKERCLKKNHKLKKHVPVELLYTKEDQRVNHRAGEELAHRLRRAINSSPRILGTCSGSKGKRLKHYKRHKGLVPSENSRFSNGHEITLQVSSDSSQADEKETIQLDLDNVETESSHSGDIKGEEINSSGRKRRRVRLKKLPLSICSSREEGTITKGSQSQLADGNKPLYQPEGSSKDGEASIMSATTWKCQGLKAPECVKQNKAVSS